MNYNYRDFPIISSDCDIMLLCNDPEYHRFQEAVNFAINYVIEEAESECQYIPNGLQLYVNRKDNIVSLMKKINNEAVYILHEDLQTWLDLLQQEAELF